MEISNVFLITSGEGLLKCELKTTIKHGLSQSKNWVSSQSKNWFGGQLIKVDSIVNQVSRPNKNAIILFGFQELKDFDFNAPYCSKGAKSIIVILNRSENLCAFGLLNKRLVNISSAIQEAVIDNIPYGGVIKVTVKETSAQRKGSLEIFYPFFNEDPLFFW